MAYHKRKKITINQKKTQMDPMSKIYFELIKQNITKIDEVPKELREEVNKSLDWHKNGYS